MTGGSDEGSWGRRETGAPRVCNYPTGPPLSGPDYYGRRPHEFDCRKANHDKYLESQLPQLGTVGKVKLLKFMKFSEGVRTQRGEEVPAQHETPQASQSGQLGGRHGLQPVVAQVEAGQPAQVVERQSGGLGERTTREIQLLQGGENIRVGEVSQPVARQV